MNKIEQLVREARQHRDDATQSKLFIWADENQIGKCVLLNGN